MTLEGIEGAGKSSALGTIERYFTAQGRPCLVTREPGGTTLGEQVRSWLLDRASVVDRDAEALLIFAARAQHLATVIRPALAAGKVVICDRFTDATYAYQGAARGLGFERIAVLEQWTQGTLRPDLTFLLDVPVATSVARLVHREGELDRFETEASSFFERVREGYQRRAQDDPGRIRVLDATGSPPQVQGEIERLLRESRA